MVLQAEYNDRIVFIELVRDSGLNELMHADGDMDVCVAEPADNGDMHQYTVKKEDLIFLRVADHVSF